VHHLEKTLQSVDFSDFRVHHSCMQIRVIERIVGRRRERDLARQIERRVRAQIDARAEAAARMADGPRS
jgi:hypothetical protein